MKTRKDYKRKSGYTKTYLYSTSNKIQKILSNGRTLKEIAEKDYSLTSSDIVEGWINSYNNEYNNDPEWFESHPVNISLFYDFLEVIKEIENEDSTTNKYFTEETLKEAVGESGMKQIELVTINPGDAFLNGEPTNVQLDPAKQKSNILPYTPSSSGYKNGNLFNQVGDIIGNGGEGAAGLLSNLITNTTADIFSNSSIINTVTNTGALGLGAYGIGRELITNSPEIITTLATTIISKSIEVVTEEVTKATTQYLANHLQYTTSFQTKVTSYAMAYFNANKISIGEILKTLNESVESRSQQLNDQSNKRNLSYFISQTKAKTDKFTEKINKYVDIGTSYLGMITNYIENGPEWVIDKTDKKIGELVSAVNKEIDDQWEKDKKAYDDKARDLGEKLGQEMVDKYNKTLKEAQKKNLEKINKQKTKASLKLTAAKAVAVSKIASMTGLYIPV